MNKSNFGCYVGTRIQIGNQRRLLLNRWINMLFQADFQEIDIPGIQFQDIFKDKIGENKNLMFLFEDRGGRKICLAPEYTAVVQNIIPLFKDTHDMKLFYIAKCFRGEKPQYLRFREFTQLGVEIINPTSDHTAELISLATKLVGQAVTPSDRAWYNKIKETITINRDAHRGLDYYVDPITKLPVGKGFEISCNVLGSAAQIVGGGSYQGGQGFALGVDRLFEINQLINNFDIFPTCKQVSTPDAVV